MLWTIQQLEVMNKDGLQNVVVMSRYKVSDVQDGIPGAVDYSVELPAPQPDQPFTPYNQITQEQAVAWTKEALGPDRVAATEAEVQRVIDSQRIPVPQPAPLPWDAQPEDAQ